MDNLYETESERSTNSGILFKTKVSEIRDMFDGKSVDSKASSSNNTCVCSLCGEKSGSFIILTCNHIFHVKCLVEHNFKDIYNYPIDSEYFDSRHCTVCNEPQQTEDLMYLHSKFLTSTKNLISKHQNSIENLEAQLKNIKSELRTCYEYKHKLEQQREKSKQIVSVLSTMM